MQCDESICIHFPQVRPVSAQNSAVLRSTIVKLRPYFTHGIRHISHCLSLRMRRVQFGYNQLRSHIMQCMKRSLRKALDQYAATQTAHQSAV